MATSMRRVVALAVVDSVMTVAVVVSSAIISTDRKHTVNTVHMAESRCQEHAHRFGKASEEHAYGLRKYFVGLHLPSLQIHSNVCLIMSTCVAGVE